MNMEMEVEEFALQVNDTEKGIARRLTVEERKVRNFDKDCDYLYILLMDTTVSDSRYGRKQEVVLEEGTLLCGNILRVLNSVDFGCCPITNPELPEVDYLSCCVKNPNYEKSEQVE